MEHHVKDNCFFWGFMHYDLTKLEIFQRDGDGYYICNDWEDKIKADKIIFIQEIEKPSLNTILTKI